MFPRILLLITICGIGLGLLLGTPSTSAENTETLDAEVRKLLVQKRDVLQELLKVSTGQYMGGVIGYRQMVDAENLLLEVELELATSKQDRIAVIKSRLQNRRDMEKVMEGRFHSGTVSKIDLLAVQAECLDAQIALLRESGAKE